MRQNSDAARKALSTALSPKSYDIGYLLHANLVLNPLFQFVPIDRW